MFKSSIFGRWVEQQSSKANGPITCVFLNVIITVIYCRPREQKLNDGGKYKKFYKIFFMQDSHVNLTITKPDDAYF